MQKTQRAMKNLYWKLADYNMYIGIQCREYQKRHRDHFMIIMKWWFLCKCLVKNQFVGKHKGSYLTEEEILKKVKEYEIISFDVFDTLLIRPYDKPTDLFYELEQKCDMHGFAIKRIEAERKARQKYKAYEEINLKQIYEMMESPFNQLQRQEIELEKEIVEPNKSIKNIYDEIIKMKKRLIITSDMYLSKDIIRSLLQVNGYNGYEDIFVSSDVGFTKNSGNMYSYIIKKMDEDPQNYLHIGDNFYSDGNACWKCGMNYLYVDSKKGDYIIFEN